MKEKQHQFGPRRSKTYYSNQDATRISTVRALEAENKKIKEENRALRRSLKDTQDELENWRSKYHAVDKDHGILSAHLQNGFLAEMIKYILSALGVGFGFYFLSVDQPQSGYFCLIASSVLYFLVVFWQNSKK